MRKIRVAAIGMGLMFWLSGFGIAGEYRAQRQTVQRSSRQNYQQTQYGGRYLPRFSRYEQSDWSAIYDGRRPEPRSGIIYNWANLNQPGGINTVRSYPVSYDPVPRFRDLPPPHFYHGGRPGYNIPGGQQVVVVNNGGGQPQFMDPNTALVIEGGQTLRMILAFLFGPKPAQAASGPRQQGQCAPEARNDPPPPCTVPQEQQNLPSAGIIIIGGSDMVRTAVEKEMLDRGQIIVANRSRAGRELHISEKEYGDPWFRIELRLIDVRTSRVISATDGTRQYRAGNENAKYAAVRDAARAAVKELNL